MSYNPLNLPLNETDPTQQSDQKNILKPLPTHIVMFASNKLSPSTPIPSCIFTISRHHADPLLPQSLQGPLPSPYREDMTLNHIH